VDELTGLPDRREARAWLEDRAQNGSLTVALLDIDDMGAFNEAHGVVAGDFLLQALAHQLRGGAAPDELAARVGGEEFLLGWTERDARDAATGVEALCRDFNESTLELADGTRCSSVTLSAGIATLPTPHGPPSAVENLLVGAERALAAAKRRGGNCVAIDEDA
jgi:diguanylate cyclase (GGDEF)-like protein